MLRFIFLLLSIPTLLLSNPEHINRSIELLQPYNIEGHQKVRYGALGDGGYIVVSGFEYDSLYSYGICDDVSFEESFISHNQVPSYLYDHTIDGLPDNFNTTGMTWEKEGAAPYKQAGLNTLRNHIRSHGDQKNNKLFLKMDIEGAEWDILEKIDENTLRSFQQIVIEYHGIGDDSWSASSHTKVNVLEKMNQIFYVAHIHCNNSAGAINESVNFPSVIEVTYIRKDNDLNVTKFHGNLPIAGLDYTNCLYMDEIHYQY